MTEEYKYHTELFVTPTPAGAYYCVSSKENTPERRLLHHLLLEKTTPRMSLEQIGAWLGMDSEKAIAGLIYHCQTMGWIGGLDQARHVPEGKLEELLPGLLKCLSDKETAILADSQGFYICAQGVTSDIAEEVSALSADIASLHDRHQQLIQKKLELHTGAWSLVDAAGNSQMGFWPMFIGDQRFVLVIEGVPQMNQMQLTNLIWVLYRRYGA